MSDVVDSLDITGMKKSDFEQLEEIFYHFKQEEIYWGRKDYWDKRMVRLEQWLSDSVLTLINNDTVIKEV